jgi:predicted transcriptional regulator
MSSRRSRFEIYVDVLAEIKNGSNKPTQIMYAANLSWRPLQEILGSLVTQGLISEIGEDIKDKRTKVQFDLTVKGENVVRYYSKAKSLIETQRPEEHER